MNADDLEFYSRQIQAMTTRYTAVFQRQGWKNAEEFFAAMSDELYGSPSFVWQFLCGFEEDLRRALAAPPKTNKRALLEKMAHNRAGRITREYRRLKSYLASL